MQFPEYVYLDYSSPFADRIGAIFSVLGIPVKPYTGEWHTGIHLLSGLDKTNTKQYEDHSLKPGPLVFFTTTEELAAGSVSNALSLCDSYILDGDPPGSISATMLASKERWEIMTKKAEQENALKAALEEKDILLKELKHRIKNTLTIIENLLSLAQSKINDKKALSVFEDSRSRVLAMAVLYDSLLYSQSQSSINLKKYLSELCESIKGAYRLEGTHNFDIDIPDLETESRIAVNLGLIVNEAVTNSIKYGRTPGSILEIELQVTREKTGDRYSLCISDNGPGLPENFLLKNSKGLGLLLVQALTEQLGAFFKLESSPNKGVRLEICGIKT
ncbi:hypothetical protein MASR2M29_02940 [Spirochaetota bacterium]